MGFVGLGNMGAHMARNLLKKGHELMVYDISKPAVDELVQAGAKAAGSPAEVAANTKTILTMLPATQHVHSVYLGDSGILGSVQSGSLLIDSSTIDPSASQNMLQLAADKGAAFTDAPVSGGVNAARDGILTFMVGAREEDFPTVQKLLDLMGKNVIHCGPVGMGQAAKICNNMLLAISMIGTSETMNLGISLGLEPKMLAKILNMSTGRCWSSDTYNPCPGVIEGVPSSNEYKGGFGVALMAKDLGLAQNASTATKSPALMGSLAHQVYRLMTNSGYDTLDFSSVFRFIQQMNQPQK